MEELLIQTIVAKYNAIPMSTNCRESVQFLSSFVLLYKIFSAHSKKEDLKIIEYEPQLNLVTYYISNTQLYFLHFISIIHMSA